MAFALCVFAPDEMRLQRRPAQEWRSQMNDLILSIAAGAFLATPVILYSVFLGRTDARKSSPPKGNASFQAHLAHK